MTLADTKERALPWHAGQTLDDYLVYLKQLALYHFAAGLCQGKIVLDLGCGEGYGSASLARSARQVVAADYSFEAVVHARNNYAAQNLAFVVCDARHLPFRDDAFDALVSFEVIEHMQSVPEYLAEIKRVLPRKTTAILSTPNRLLRLLPFQKPWNRYHVREYDDRELARVLNAAFVRVQLLGATAIPPILEIEKRRVKQNPFVAYPRMLAQMLLPRSIYALLKGAEPPAPPAKIHEDWNAGAFSVNDFMLSADELRECITLVAVCER
jgi:ubiquinone/menaquinone biosynthesis C-methylase UbiE